MKKCAQCGKDVPTGNTTCNYCGYNPEELNKKPKYSFGKITNHGVGKVVNGNGNSKIGKLILIFFVTTFVGPFILGVVFIIILFVTGVFEEEEPISCSSYCVGEYVYGDGYCYCSNGNIFDEYGDIVNNLDNIDFSNLNYNIHVFETDTVNLDRVVNNQEDVVVVVCSNFSDNDCNSYAIRMLNIAQRENFNLFVYQYETLDEQNQNKLLNYYLDDYIKDKPLTFIISNGRMKSAIKKNMIRSDIEDYLSSNGII